jgi:hypothetical protein
MGLGQPPVVETTIRPMHRLLLVSCVSLSLCVQLESAHMACNLCCGPWRSLRPPPAPAYTQSYACSPDWLQAIAGYILFDTRMDFPEAHQSPLAPEAHEGWR